MYEIIKAFAKWFFVYRKCSHEWGYLHYFRKSDGEPIPCYRECAKCGKRELVGFE